jgi:hypothetical protein
MEGKNVGEKLLDLAAIGIPAFGTTGPTITPFYFRTPGTQNWDLSLFKNFKIKESKVLQLRFGFFNVFNQAFAKNFDNQNSSNSDIFLTLGTACRRTAVNQNLVLSDGTFVSQFTDQRPNGAGGTGQGAIIPGTCDFTTDTKNNFGKILTKRGQRVVEMALKFTF